MVDKESRRRVSELQPQAEESNHCNQPRSNSKRVGDGFNEILIVVNTTTRDERIKEANSKRAMTKVLSIKSPTRPTPPHPSACHLTVGELS